MQKSLKVAAFGGVLFIISLAIGPIFTATAMLRAFEGAGSEPVPSEDLAADMQQAMSLSAICLPFAFIGLCLVVGGLVAYAIGRERTPRELERSRDDR